MRTYVTLAVLTAVGVAGLASSGCAVRRSTSPRAVQVAGVRGMRADYRAPAPETVLGAVDESRWIDVTGRTANELATPGMASAVAPAVVMPAAAVATPAVVAPAEGGDTDLDLLGAPPALAPVPSGSTSEGLDMEALCPGGKCLVPPVPGQGPGSNMCVGGNCAVPPPLPLENADA
ncbi:MAG: hypothetical protein AB7T63_08520 [Planctomycetota bacterium]